MAGMVKRIYRARPAKLQSQVAAVKALTAHVREGTGAKFRRGQIVGTNGAFYQVQPNGEAQADGHNYAALGAIETLAGTPTPYKGSATTLMSVPTLATGSLDTRGGISFVATAGTAATGQLAALIFGQPFGLTTVQIAAYRGLWLVGTAYAVGDLVAGPDFEVYTCITANTGNSVFHTADWTLIALPSPFVQLSPTNGQAAGAGFYIDQATCIGPAGFGIYGVWNGSANGYEYHYQALLDSLRGEANASLGYDVLPQEIGPGNHVIVGFLKNS